MRIRWYALAVVFLVGIIALLWMRLSVAALLLADITSENANLRQHVADLEAKLSRAGVKVEQASATAAQSCDARVADAREEESSKLRSILLMTEAANDAAASRACNSDAPVASPRDECVPFTYWVALGSGNNLEQMSVVRDQLDDWGWTLARVEEEAAFVLDNGERPPAKRSCQMPEGSGLRLTGSFDREAIFCHKHYLSQLARRRPQDSSLRASVPQTFDVTDHALEGEIPCEGPNDRFLIKGDAHGGREVWQPPTFESLRSSISMPQCVKASASGSAPIAATFQAKIVQEIIHPIQWEKRNVLSRIYFAVTRKGQARICPGSGRWNMGMSVGYDLHLFEEPYFILYPGVILDDAPKDSTLRKNRTEMDEFMRKAGAPSAQRAESWVQTAFLPRIINMTREAFLESEYPADGEHGHYRNLLEPDGTYFVFAAEYLITPDFDIRLVEYTSMPQVTTVNHGPSTEFMPSLLGREFAALLLRVAGQDKMVGVGPKGGIGSSSHWRHLATRETLPHP